VLTIVVTDANVLINLIHIDSLALLGRLAGFRFVVVEEVILEISEPDQARALAQALESGWISRESLENPEGLELFATLVRTLGRGEAASLALSVTCGYAVACDERRVFRREALARLGEKRILTTPGIMLLAIRAGLISVEEADGMKRLLEQRRFVMTFASFSELM
jgi:predicted nucleic acid-binding protein